MGQKHFMLSLYRLGRQIPVQGDLSGQLRTILPLHGTTAPLQQSQMAIAVRRNSHHQSIPAADRPDADFFRYIRDSIPLPQRIHPHSTSSSMTNRSFQTTITPVSYTHLGQSLPSVDNLYALSRLFQISMNEILVPASCYTDPSEQQAAVCCSNHRAGDVLLKRRLRRASKLPGSGPFKRLKRVPCFSRRMIRLNEQLAAIPG